MGRHALVNPLTFPILWEAWANPFTTKSDFAREHATAIGILASEGMLTLRHTPWGGAFRNVWRVTPEGLLQLWTFGEANKDLLTRHAASLETVHQEQDQDSSN